MLFAKARLRARLCWRFPEHELRSAAALDSLGTRYQPIEYYVPGILDGKAGRHAIGHGEIFVNRAAVSINSICCHRLGRA